MSVYSVRTEIGENMAPAQAELSATLQKFVLQYGEMASHWGLNKTEAQIHGLLFISEKPLTAEEITSTLSVARSNVSNSLKELQQWGHVKTVHVMGDRREHYESVKDVWELFRIVVNEQKRREIDPVVRMLEETVSTLEADGKKGGHAKEQLSEMLEFFKLMTSWYEEMTGVPLPIIKNFLKLGSKAIKALG